MHAVRPLMGVNGVIDTIKIRSEIEDAAETKIIENAIKRNWNINDKNIRVEATGHTAILSGNVPSFYQRDEAVRTTWDAPGVWAADNNLVVN